MRSTINWEDPGLPERDGVQNSVQDLDFSRDGEILVVAVANLVLIYDAKEGDLLHRLRGHKVKLHRPRRCAWRPCALRAALAQHPDSPAPPPSR